MAGNSLPLLHDTTTVPPVRFALLHFILEFPRPVALPAFVGPYLRGIIGDHLGQSFCQFPERREAGCCQECHCEFATLFRGYHPDAGDNFTSPPFVLKVRTLNEPRTSLRQLHFDLLLLGPAFTFASDFCRALQEGYISSKTNAFTLNSVLSTSRRHPASLYYDGMARQIVGPLHQDEWSLATLELPPLPTPDAPVAKGDTLSLHLVTPTRLNVDKNYRDKPFAFKDLVRALLNRYRQLSALELLYQGQLDPARAMFHARHYAPLLDYLDASAINVHSANLTWHQNESYSVRQQKRFSTGGLIGQIVYTGHLAPFLPLLQWGELFQVGEKTNYGMGEYQILE